MAQRVELSAEDREELAYKLICWMKKWGLWDHTTLFSRETHYSSGIISKLARPGWRGWEDVWTSPYTGEFREELDTDQFLSIVAILWKLCLNTNCMPLSLAASRRIPRQRCSAAQTCLRPVWIGMANILKAEGVLMIRNLIPLMNIGYWSQSTGMTSNFGCLGITCMRRWTAGGSALSRILPTTKRWRSFLFMSLKGFWNHITCLIAAI